MTRELADVAEAIVAQVARDQFRRRADRFGTPRRQCDGERSRWAIVGLGKLGGRELNYHSDLDLVFLHESDGETRGGHESVSNDQFMTEVVRRVLKALGDPAAPGPLYAVDTRLRPHGSSGPLVVTLEAFADYFRGQAQLVGAAGPDPRAGRLRDRGLRPGGRRDDPRRPGHAGRPGGPRPRGRRHAPEARRDLPPSRPEARVRRAWPTSSSSSSTSSSSTRRSLPRSSAPTSGTPWPRSGSRACSTPRRPPTCVGPTASCGPSRGACGSSTIAGTPTSPITPTSSPGWPAASTTRATTARPSPPSAPTPTATRPGPATGITELVGVPAGEG